MVYADYISLGNYVFVTWLWKPMKNEFENDFKHLFWRFYKKR